MGNNEETKSSKSEKPSSPVTPDQTGIHVYPDWAAMHAYYGPRVALPPYYNSAVSSGHGPHPYMWGPPQPMMPPYGPPYAAIYSHGGVYGHPAIPITPTPLAAETPKKSSPNSDNGLVKKLKSFEGLAMSIGSADADSADDASDKRSSQSAYTGGSSDGDQSGADKAGRKRSREGISSIGDGKSEVQAKGAGKVDAASENVSGGAICHPSATGKLVAPVISPSISASLELKNSCMDADANPVSILQPGAVVPSESWLQNERELKRERRKQSNRESARRSRLRKQAETEELAKKVDALTADNVALKSEISRLTENSDKLRLENTTLMERLGNARGGEKEVESLGKFNDNGLLSDKTENLLSRVNNSGAIDRRSEDEGEIYERKSNAGAKLHQLLDSKPRTDAVAAG
ncbi:common plant regulatory factor 1 isoform X2 [Rhodamnia argentea]|uniref:Common plant regulatory factor 1 isoform X2 n=1 Tax=Rhodamnia argentea TaxID=178133 RepID=A0A8B8QP13_9MYRT|nr:common plant regulatory factor 1 isoform X2 [Rhodamnia argentea]XP_048132684.1 common plant regulatory factor 1 isoform X2 [Rhodamnia argentea]